MTTTEPPEPDGYLQACVSCDDCLNMYCVVALDPSSVPCPACGSSSVTVESEDPWRG